MEIKTPNGFKVVLKEVEELTYRDHRAIQRIFMRGAELSGDQSSQKISMHGDSINDCEDEILKAILLKIYDPQGKELTGDLFETIMSWKAPEADEVFEYVSKVFQAANVSKKK